MLALGDAHQGYHSALGLEGPLGDLDEADEGLGNALEQTAESSQCLEALRLALEWHGGVA